MKFRPIFYIQGLLLIFVGISMIFPAAFSWYYGDDDIAALLISAGLSIGIGLLLYFPLRFKGELRIRESYAIVTLGWIVCSLAGSLPFYISGYIPSFTDAFFRNNVRIYDHRCEYPE